MRKKVITVFILFASFAVVAFTSSVNRNYVLEASVDVPAEVTIGTEIDVSMIDITYKGETKKASSLVVYTPSGAKLYSTKVNFNEAGKYVFEFSALFGNKKITKTMDTMSIRTPVSMFHTSNASIAQDSFAYKLDDSLELTDYKGVKINSRDGGTVTFNKVLDFSKSTKNDAFIDFVVEPSTPGAYDIGELIITLTDADDPTNKVDIRYVDGLAGSSNRMNMTYASARATGQNYAGYENWAGVWHTNADQTGAPTFLTLRGLSEQQSETDYFNSRLFFDYSSKQILVESEYSYANSKVLINDLDNLNVYPTNPWSGFKSGRAILSITTNDVAGVGGIYVIKSIFGYNLSSKLLKDNEAPQLSIDFDGYDRSNLPLAKKSNTYPLFSADAFDNLDDDLILNTKVQFYDENHKTYIDINHDGKRFNTDYYGKYYVSYYCSDRSGNDVEDSYIVNCSSIIEDIEMIIPEDTSIYHAYGTVNLCSLDEVVVNNAQGRIELSRYLISPDATEVELKNDYFVPTSIGVYKIKYVVSDIYNNPVTKIVNYNITNLEHPVIIESINLPAVMIKGQYYELPRIGCKYPNGNEIADGEVEIFVNNTLFTKDKLYVETTNNIKIDYVPHSASAYKQTFNIKVVEGNSSDGKFIKSNYFYAEDAKSYSVESIKNKALQFTVNNDSEINFIKSISSNDLSLSFSLDESTIANYGSFAIKIRDKNDVNKVLTLRIVSTVNGLKLLVPFDNVAKDLDSDVSRQFEIYYRPYYRTLCDRNYKDICEIKYYDNGDAFTGFSEEVYVSFYFIGLTKPAKASLIFINNQSFKTSIAKDNAGPQIITDSSLNWANELGQEITISKASAYDVLSYVEYLYVTMTDSDGNKILNNADASIEHKVILDKYGSYRIEYSSKDGNGRTSNRSFTICCVENEVPVLNVNFNPSDHYSLGSTFNLPTHSFDDNSKNCSLDISLYLPNGQGIAIEHDTMIEGEIFMENYLDVNHYSDELVASNHSIKLFMTGKFILRYLVIDAYGNVSYREFVLNVR